MGNPVTDVKSHHSYYSSRVRRCSEFASEMVVDGRRLGTV